MHSIINEILYCLPTVHVQSIQIEDIPIGQYVRARRNCSIIDKFEGEAKKLRQCFLARGYRKANNSLQELLLFKGLPNSEPVPIIVTHYC